MESMSTVLIVLQRVFREILLDLSDDELSQLVNAAQSAGIRHEADLQYLAVDDISGILPPIQIRKLLKCLQLRYHENSVTVVSVSSPATVTSVMSPSPSHSCENYPQDSSTPRSSGSGNSENRSQRRAADSSNWVEQFKIPWSKCPESLISALDKGGIVDCKDLRQLVSHTVSDIFNFTKRASRANLREVAMKIVRRSPKSFADYINDKMIGDGISTIMLMLESKKENLNRRLGLHQMSECTKRHTSMASTSADVDASTSADVDQNLLKPRESNRRSKMSASSNYGCLKWNPATPDGETVETLEQQRKQLCLMHLNEGECSEEANQLMESTFCYQRQMINESTPVGEVLDKWPYLAVADHSLKHFRRLTGFNLEVVLPAALSKKADLVYEFFLAESRTSAELKQILDDTGRLMKSTGSKQPLHNSLVLMMASYFGETSDCFIRFNSVFILCSINKS